METWDSGSACRFYLHHQVTSTNKVNGKISSFACRRLSRHETDCDVLKAHGIQPAPAPTLTGSWETLLKAHWDVIASIDFTTVEVWTKNGLTTFYLLFVMELKTRRVHFEGGTTNPNQAWMDAIACELTNHEDGFLKNKIYWIMDRDATFSKPFRASLRREGVKQFRLPPRSPNLNAHPERFFGSLKSEFLIN